MAAYVSLQGARVSLKERLFLVILLVCHATARDTLFLDITDYSYSKLELSCRLEYNGNLTDVFFEVYKGEFSCLYRTTEFCRTNYLNNCKIECQQSQISNILPFEVLLDGTCEEILYVKCTTGNTATEKLFSLEESIKWTAQGDPPVISVNNSQPLEASCNPVEIFCTISNACYETMIDISAEVPLELVTTTHTKVGNRFTSTAIATAVFDEAGQYSIACRETGKEEQFSRNFTLEVYSRTQGHTPEITINNNKLVNASYEPIQIVCSIINICYITKLDILGKFHMKPVNLTSTKKGSRFNTTGTSTAIFDKAGNYTIVCKETGREDHFASNLTLRVHPKAEVVFLKDVVNEPIVSPATVATSVFLVIFMLSTAVLGFLLFMLYTGRWSKSEKKKPSSELLPLLEDRTIVSSKGGVPGTQQCKRKMPEMLIPEDIICVIWSNEDENIAGKISDFIQNKKIEIMQANIELNSFVQEGSNYTKYIAIISSHSLNNNNFLAYLTSVVSRTCNTNQKSTVLLVLVDEGHSIWKNHLDRRLTKDLQALPMVKAFPVLDNDCLDDIVSNIEGKLHDGNFKTDWPLRKVGSFGIGNVGIGLAWSHYYGYLKTVLPEVNKKLKKTELYIKHHMSSKFIIIIAAFGRTQDNLHDVDSKFSYLRTLDHISKTVAWHPHRPDKATIYQLKNSPEERYYFCGEYGYHILSLSGLLDSGKLTEVMMCQQLEEFANALQMILRKKTSPEESHIHVVKDVTKLAEELCEFIKEDKEPVDTKKGGKQPVDTKLTQVENLPSSRVAQGFVYYYYHNHLAVIGPNMAERIKVTDYYLEKKMPAKLFILLPYSCRSISNQDLEYVGLKEVGKLDPQERTFAGQNFDHDNFIHEISDGQETYYACVEYCTHVHVMYEMGAEPLAGMSSFQKAAELRVFYEILNDMLSASSAPAYCHNFELVYYDDDQNSGVKLSKKLIDKIKESLKEEDMTQSQQL